MDETEPISTALLNASDAAASEAGEGDPETAGYEIRYYLREEKCGEDGHTGYGVTAELCRNGKVVSRADVSDVTIDKMKMLELIVMLSRNSVTPITLTDVIEDSLA
jgi:hypothetical protein